MSSCIDVDHAIHQAGKKIVESKSTVRVREAGGASFKSGVCHVQYYF